MVFFCSSSFSRLPFKSTPKRVAHKLLTAQEADPRPREPGAGAAALPARTAPPGRLERSPTCFGGVHSAQPKANRPFSLLAFQVWPIFSHGPKRLTFVFLGPLGK